MRRLIPVLLIAGLLAGCANGKFVKPDLPNSCSSTGWTLTAIHYGDSRIVVIPISEVVQGAEFRFVLTPADENTDSRDYKDVEVTVKGKPPHDSWFEATSGKASVGDGTIRVCIDGPTSMLAVDDEFFYIVEVEDVGILDPRGKVIVRPD